ncbi:MAG: rRNA (adenine2503-C2)-methyltransferase [Actinomycetota bacterium]|nr:rRNA (adenine2503-C2)-methyltransferase [Actinomycetota bacterium]
MTGPRPTACPDRDAGPDGDTGPDVAEAVGSPGGGKPPRHLADLDPAQRAAAVRELGERPFRARQLSVHYFEHGVRDPDLMTDLPRATRRGLVRDLLPELLVPVRAQADDGGDTLKTAWRLFDGVVVESVLMLYPDRATVCVSSQAGCAMGCPFCATGRSGFIRNLSTAEIVEQVVLARRDARTAGADRVGNVVFMGMGEPLANYGAVLRAVRRLGEAVPDGLGLSPRGTTISTVGLVPAMERLAGEGLPITLALSLHAPDDRARDELVPVNRRWPVGRVLDAARHHFEATGRRVSIEYALIRDVNDQPWRAELLARELSARGLGWAHVNAIPLNDTPGSRWTASPRRVTDEFVRKLRERRISTTIRLTRGRRIDGACGQLAATSRLMHHSAN